MKKGEKTKIFCSVSFHFFADLTACLFFGLCDLIFCHFAWVCFSSLHRFRKKNQFVSVTFSCKGVVFFFWGNYLLKRRMLCPWPFLHFFSFCVFMQVQVLVANFCSCLIEHSTCLKKNICVNTI